MADESDSGQEKTEQPTAKKLKDAKEKGQVPRSKELNSMTIMVFGGIGLLTMGGYMLASVTTMMKQGFTLSREQVFESSFIINQLKMAITTSLGGLAPFLVLMLVVAIATPMLLGGWSFSLEALAVKTDRLNPLKGLKRIFSAKGLMELVKAMAKFGVVMLIAGIFIVSHSDELLNLGQEPLNQALAHGAELLGLCFLVVSSALIVIAAIDMPFQLWDHSEKLKMTLQEVRDEMKDTEGKPEVKSKIRQLQQDMSQRRMMEAVPDADVIITNPTHFAVALKYDREKMAVPIVVALGKDLMALKIREIGKAHDVEIFEAPPLARALYANSELDKEIPGHLYFAVAQVLAFVFQLRNAKEQGLEIPVRPDPQMPINEEA
ncbi:MAG: flagellar biosynthetic protein FlhB [Gammaproteobacteria bacterium]|jgi:flagellar biosynthetic protein FlhB